MRVTFDAERLRNLNSGLGQFCRSLGGALVASRPQGADLSFIVPPSASGIFGADVRHVPTRWHHRFRAPTTPDVWHAAHQDVWIRPPRTSALVLSIMDLNFLERADYSEAKKARRLAAVQKKLDRASAVATISEYTASVVRAHLRVGDVPLRVIHLGNPLDAGGDGIPDPRIVELAGSRFFLFVGVLHPKKNVASLVAMMPHVPDYRLIIAGPGGGAYAGELRAMIDRLRIPDRVHIVGAVSDATRRWLYGRSRALLFPSLSEGFGLPVVEAMSMGTPAFISRLTSLPEIGGDAARYFDSFEPEAMASVVREGLASHDADPASPDRLKAFAARYSWTRAATAYWTLYAEVHRAHRR